MNLFSWFCFEIIGCCFGHSETPRDKLLRPNQQPLILKNKTMKTNVTHSLFSCDMHYNRDFTYSDSKSHHYNTMSIIILHMEI